MLQESVTPTGPNGWKLKSNPIQSTFVSKVIQSVSCQDVWLQSATTNTQVSDTHATRTLKHALQLEDRNTNGKAQMFKSWSRTLSSHSLRNKMKTKSEESSITSPDTKSSRITLGLKFDLTSDALIFVYSFVDWNYLI